MRNIGILGWGVALAALIVAAFPTAGHAYTPEEQAACQPDAFRLCGSEIPNIDRVKACMLARRAQLSPECKRYFRPDTRRARRGDGAVRHWPARQHQAEGREAGVGQTRQAGCREAGIHQTGSSEEAGDCEAQDAGQARRDLIAASAPRRTPFVRRVPARQDSATLHARRLAAPNV